MRVDRSAVPKLINTAPQAGAGAGRSAAEWAAAIAALRPRLQALSAGELIDLLHDMEFGDLVGLVISPPFASDLLGQWQSGLSAAVSQILVSDCARYGERQLDADLAAGILQRSSVRLAACEQRRATDAQLIALQPLVLQLAALADDGWYHRQQLPSETLLPFIALTGGIDGPFGRRLQSLASPAFWQMCLDDYPAAATEPLPRPLAEQALSGIAALLAGQDWPFASDADGLSAEEMSSWLAEMETLLQAHHQD